jgi:hypothetical protein
LRTVVTLATGLCAACTPYDPTLGPEPFFCGSAEPKCPDGYACTQPAGSGSAVCARQAPSGGGNCTMTFSGVLATWDFAGQPGSQTSSAAKSMAPGVTAGMVTRSSALTASAGTNSINSSNWPTAAQLGTTRYYTLSVTPPTGCSLSLASVAIDVAASSTGPTAAAVAASTDAFAQPASISTTSPSTPSLSLSPSSSAVELRVYGYSAGATTGTMRVQNVLTVTGSLQ